MHWLFWPAFALVIPQALWVKRTATRFDDATGPAKGQLDGPNPVSLVGIGDSIIAGVGCLTLDQALIGHTARALQSKFSRGVDWQALGKTGATTGRVLKRFVPQLPDQPVDVFLVSAGVNDLTALKTLDHWSAALKALLESLHQHSPQARIVLLGMPPMHNFPLLPQPLRAVFGFRARSFDATARKLLNGLDYAIYVPFEGDLKPDQFAPDGYHPSEDSCKEIALEIVQALVQNNLRA